jgi:hypothetical protein
MYSWQHNIFGLQTSRLWEYSIDLSDSRQEGTSEHGNDPSGSLKCEEFIDQLNEY